MDKVFREPKELVPKGPAAPGLHPITHKEFNEFIKGKGFTGRNNYKLQVYVPQNIRKIYFLHKISKKSF